MDHDRLRTLALGQHGIVTRRQVLDLGGSDRTIQRAVGSGRWARAREGIYVVGASPPTWQQRALGAALAAGPGVLLTARSAARAWGLVERSGGVQLLVEGDRRVRLPGIEVRRTRLLDPTDRAVVDGLPVTGLARTLVEIAPAQSPSTMGMLVDSAIRLHGIDVDEIAGRALALTVPGRPRPWSLIDALSLRCPGYDPGRSALEARVLALLAREGLPEPERQIEVVRPDGRTAFIDLGYPGPRVAIEADGWAFHGQRAAFDQDRIRHNELVLLGWSVLHLTSAMPDALICRVVAAALAIDPCRWTPG